MFSERKHVLIVQMYPPNKLLHFGSMKILNLLTLVERIEQTNTTDTNIMHDV